MVGFFKGDSTVTIKHKLESLNNHNSFELLKSGAFEAAKSDTTLLTNLITNFATLKQQFRTALVTIKGLPSSSERQFHKYILELRNDLTKLPKQTFMKLNKQLYSNVYFNTTILLNRVLKNHKIALKTSIKNNQLGFYLKKLSSKVDRSFFVNDQSHYFEPKTANLALGNEAIFTINVLAIRFILEKLKKMSNHLYFERKERQKGPLHRASSMKELEKLGESRFAPECTPTSNAPLGTQFFYYNLYSLADDHLWENINDWNLLKSYITVNPDVMDRPIPSYKHRIPLSGLNSFLTQSIGYEPMLIKFAGLWSLLQTNYYSTKKYSRATDTFAVFTCSRKKTQAISHRLAGAGVINTFLTSITFPELQAMHKQLTVLLRESRKGLLRVNEVFEQNTSDTSSPFSKAGRYHSQNENSSHIAFLDPRLRLNNNLLNYGSGSLYDENWNSTGDLFSNKEDFDSTLSSTVQDSDLDGRQKEDFSIVSEKQFAEALTNNELSNDFQLTEESEAFDFTLTKTVSHLHKPDRFSSIDKRIEKHYELLRRAKLLKKFTNTKVLPKNLMLTILPVLPPELRPIMKMADQIATSDINRLYQRVLYRNERLAKISLQLTQSLSSGFSRSKFSTETSPTVTSSFGTDLTETPVFGYEKHYAQRLLQEAVDNLIDNGRAGGNSEKDAKGRALKSLSEVLKGKQGRFRQYLLGKRVDYSGRSVIVVGPQLKIHQCGLPREMAVELYLPFIIQYLIQMKYTKTVVGAKTLINNNKQLVESILENVVRGHPIILNRAPTLHRLGFQAFQPILVDGRAILLHPMACTAFNADFDGDQMAVHIPITVEARSEAWRLMLARNNLLSPATGDPIILPSQDMVLGCYYLTTLRKYNHKNSQIQKSNQYYSNIDIVLYLYNRGDLHVHSPVWVKCLNTVFTDSIKKPVEIRVNRSGGIHEIYKNTELYYDSNGLIQHQFIRTTPGRILFNLILKNM